MKAIARFLTVYIDAFLIMLASVACAFVFGAFGFASLSFGVMAGAVCGFALCLFCLAATVLVCYTEVIEPMRATR